MESINSEWIKVTGHDLKGKCDTTNDWSWKRQNGNNMWETSDLQPYMDRVIAHDNDAFAIVTSNGRWFGSVWYKKFNENKNKNCDMPQGLVELNQLDIKSNVDIYIRKSSVACYT